MTPSRIRNTKTIDGVRYFRHQCVNCRMITNWTTKERMHCVCGVKREPEDISQHFPEASRQLLFGDRIKQLTDALGIPQCGGCAKRQEWLNNAHAWVLKQWG
jgi:hypothetical protein